MFVYNLFRYVIFSVLKFLMFFWFYKNKNNRIVVFDLDNTVAYANFSNSSSYNSLTHRLRTMRVYPGVLNLMLAYKKKKYRVLILTARDYRFYSITRNWLVKNDVPFDKLILVHRPLLKKIILKQAQNLVTYYDDFSYNHENGQIKFYHDLICHFIEAENINYYSLNQFKRFQNKLK